MGTDKIESAAPEVATRACCIEGPLGATSAADSPPCVAAVRVRLPDGLAAFLLGHGTAVFMAEDGGEERPS